MPRPPKPLLVALALLAAPSPAHRTLIAQQGAAAASCAAPADGAQGIMSALAVAAALDLGRWNATTDFATASTAPFAVTLTATGKARCADGSCWRVQAILDLQKSTSLYISNGGSARIPVNTLALATMLSSRITSQQNCERRGGTGPTSCTVEQNKLTKTKFARGACAAAYTLEATSTSGSALKDVPQFKNKLMFAGYPSNGSLAFAANGTTVTITSPLELIDDGTSTTAAPINACTRISIANITGRACTCGGTAGKYAQSVWNRQTYTCKT